VGIDATNVVIAFAVAAVVGIVAIDGDEGYEDEEDGPGDHGKDTRRYESGSMLDDGEKQPWSLMFVSLVFSICLQN